MSPQRQHRSSRNTLESPGHAIVRSIEKDNLIKIPFSDRPSGIDPARLFNPTIAAEGRQNVAEKGHSFSERREAEIEPPESAYLRVGVIGVAELGQSAVSPCTFKGPNNQPISSIPGSRTGG